MQFYVATGQYLMKSGKMIIFNSVGKFDIWFDFIVE